MSGLHTSARRIRYQIRSLLGLYPRLFFPLLRFKGGPHGAPVDRATDLVIEGFPRSANTFALVALVEFQRRELRVAHHLHVPAQVKRAASLSLPCLVLIRDPEDAVLSEVIRNPFLTLAQGFNAYSRFYRAVLPWRGQFVVGRFDEVTNDFGRVIGRLNRRFGTDFEPFEHTPENLARCRQSIEDLDRRDTGKANVTWSTVAFPSERRQSAKKTFGEQLQEPAVRSCLDRARSIYEKIEAG